jgi:hypothetical protein
MADETDDIPDEEPAEEEQIDDAELDDLVGARLGLVLVSGLGLLLGTATSGWMWALYPPRRGQSWPIPTVGIVSGIVLLALYVFLGRRVSKQASDWLAIGYLGGLLLIASIIAGGGALQFLRTHVASSIGLSVTALPVIYRFG